MGQYHNLVCITRNACLSSYALHAGAKAREQAGHPAIGPAMAVLCATGYGTHARDLPWLDKGQWAGQPLAMVGDYAEDNDLIHPLLGGTNPPESSLYGANKNGKPSKRRKKALTCVGRALLPAIERTTNIRVTRYRPNQPTEGWQTIIGPVTFQHPGWVLNSGKRSKADKDLEVFAERADPERTYLRPPMPLKDAPDFIPPATEVGPGAAGLWVSIDSGEYIDPAAFGAHDLTDTINEHSLNGAVLTTLFHPDRRGGGDWPDDSALGMVGRWRGDRLVLLGPKGLLVDGAHLTPELVRQRFCDITGLARLWARIDNDIEESPANNIDTVDAQHAPLMAAVAPILSQAARNLHESGGITVHVRTVPTSKCTYKGRTYTLPARVDLIVNDHHLWLPAAQRAALRALAGTKGRTSITATKTTYGEDLVVSCPQASVLTLECTSAHALLGLMKPHT